mgnify:CR=1 FL=1
MKSSPSGQTSQRPAQPSLARHWEGKHHDRITNLHLKDRTADGGNVPWGQGQTPIKEVLQLMEKEKWTFPAEPERSGGSQPQGCPEGE